MQDEQFTPHLGLDRKDRKTVKKYLEKGDFSPEPPAIREYDLEIEILEEAIERSKGENYEGTFDERLSKAKELKTKAKNG